jgi:hypothetical protein
MTWAANPTKISSNGINASSAEIATDSSGNVTAVWVESGNIVTKSLPFGGSWGSLTTLDSAGTASSPLIGMANGGNAVAVWLRAGVVEYATLSGGTWTIGSSDVSSALETASNLRLAVDSSGNAIAIWQNSAGAIETATRLAGGSWSSVTTLSASGSDSPSVAIGTSTAVAVWHNISGTTHILQYSRVTTLGGSWSAAGAIYTTTAGFPLGYPKVTVDPSENATVVAYRYQQSGSSYYGVVIVSSTLVAGATNWAAPSIISNPGQTNPANLSLRVRSDPNGNVVAMWMQSTDGSTFSFNAAAMPFGGNWSFGQMVSLPGFTGTDGYLHINSIGDYVAVFMANDGTNAIIQSSDFFYGGFLPYTWSPLSIVSTGTNNGFPRVASYYASGTIYATAVWTQYDGTNTIINASSGSRVMLLAPSGIGVTQNLHDYGIVQDYYNTITWTPTTDTNAVGQILLRNGVFLASLDASATSFVDHNQPQSGHGPVVYGIAAIDQFNQLSPITTFSFP